jgi:YD repeat-containing protein
VNSLPPWVHETFPDPASACTYANYVSCSPSGNECATRTYSPGSLIAGSAATHNQLIGCNEVQSVTGTPDYCTSYGCSVTETNNFFNIAEIPVATCPDSHVTTQTPANAEVSCRNCQGDPINPEVGNMFRSETDVVFAGTPGSVAFRRFYNSADPGGADTVPKWRHSYDASVQIVTQQPIAPYPGLSATVSPQYASAADACTQGFAAIKSSVSAWIAASASYAANVCSISTSSGTIGTLPVFIEGNTTSTAPAFEYDVIREDGQTLRFPVIGGAIVNPPGYSLRLTLTGSGFTVTDDQDTVEQYDVSGHLQSITSRTGVTQTLSYNTAGQLASVVDTFGHSLTFSYYSWGGMSSVAVNGGASVQYTYGSWLMLATATNLDGTTRSYSYTDANNPKSLTGFVDESGTTESAWAYDAQNRAVSTQQAGGANAVSLVYNSDGTVTSTDALGAVRLFTFTRIGDVQRPISISGSQCPTCEEPAATTYDTAGWVSSRTDYNGNVTCYANDPTRGLELARVEGFAPGSTCPANLAAYAPANGTRQRKISTAWDAAFREPDSVTETNRTTSFTYYTSGSVHTKTITDTTVTPNISRTWTYTYNAYGQVLTADGPRTDVADVATYSYYTCGTGFQCGQLQTVTNAANQTTTLNTYNAYGQPLTITDPNGVVTTLTYDALQRLTSRQTANETTAFSYWPTGLLEQVMLPDASTLTYTYDAAHRLTQINDALGNKIVYTLDAMGNRTAENSFDPSGTLHRTHTRVFNTLNQLNKDVNAAGTAAVTTTFGYDPQGNQTSIAAPLARNTTNGYDELNRLKQITDPASGLTQFGYDANDNLTSVTDPRGLATVYAYSGFGDLATQASPDTGTTSNTYDSAGNLATSTDARGAVSTYAYDALNRVTSVAYSQGGTTDQTIAFTYDAGTNGKGHLTGASDANHSMSWIYDALGRVTSKSQTVGAVTKAAGYAYTSGDLTTLTTPSGQTVAYGYNGNHQVTSVTVNGTTVLNSAVYEPLGPLKGWTWGNGATTTRTYDTDGKISQSCGRGTPTPSVRMPPTQIPPARMPLPTT